MTTMTKQQAICLKLAQWLGKYRPFLFDGKVVYGPDEMNLFHAPEFNPFAPTTEGRSQFAECWEKAVQSFYKLAVNDVYAMAEETANNLHMVEINGDIRGATLEAIYYAIDGNAEEWEE